MKKVLLLLLLAFCLSTHAQVNPLDATKKQHLMFSGTYGYGKVMAINPFVEGDNLQGKPIENYQFFSLKALWQNPGYTNWQKVYRGPYYGFGVSMGDFYNPVEIGYPVSTYGVLGLPLLRTSFVEFFTEFQFGLASNWEHYDPITNPKNIVIGGGLTVHLDVALKMYFNLGKHIDLGAGISFIHFSNGGFERPNRGFNIYSPSAELRYRLKPRPNYKQISKPDKIEKTRDLYFMMGYGDHQLNEHEFDTNYFAVGGLSVIYFDQITPAFRLGGGVDMNYWWGLNANPDGTIGPRTFENFTLGLVVQPELIIDRLTLVSGFGIYARHLHYGSFNQSYQRLGVRFDVYKDLSLGVNVRAVNFMLAEFLEFNMGYRLKWKK